MLERLTHWLRGASPPVAVAAVASAGLDAPAATPAAGPPASGAAPSLVVIDVRSEGEFQATAIDHAVNLPLPQLEHRIGALVADKATPLVLYCASGARSGIACRMLKKLGYTNVSNAGGLYAAAARLQREVRR